MKGLESSISCTKCGFEDFELTDIWEEDNIEEIAKKAEQILLERHRKEHPECTGTTEVTYKEPGTIKPNGEISWQYEPVNPDIDIDHEVVNL